MRDSVAAQRYLARHIEADLPAPPTSAVAWHNVLVIPAYDESAQLLQKLQRWCHTQHGGERSLIILVLNHPDSDENAGVNDPLRSAVNALYKRIFALPAADIFNIGAHTDLCLLDVDALRGPLPAAQGVGMARKIGCDLAYKWIAQGAVSSEWIHCTDADATLPPDYFACTAALTADFVGAAYPFVHRAGADDSADRATALYELRVHHYVLGLEYAGSPYAMHTLGSCLAIRTAAYAHCRGFPRRAGAEDFYLLNKLAKLGPIARLQGNCIALTSRASTRVPFGTGPAVGALAGSSDLHAAPCFYHPEGFAVLKALLQSFPAVAGDAAQPLALLLAAAGVEKHLAHHAQHALQALGWQQALDHCERQAGDETQFLRYLHEWLDAFRTLKFLHALRAAGLESLSLRQLADCEPQLWPRSGSGALTDIESLRAAVRAHWQWQV